MLHGALVLSAAPARAGEEHRHLGGRGRCRACARWPPRRTCRASAGTACSTTTGRASWPWAKRCAASATCCAAIAADDEATARAGRRAGEGRLRGARRRCSTPSSRSRPGAPARQPHARQPAVAAPSSRRGDVDAALAPERPRRHRHLADPAHRAPLPGARVRAGRAAGRTARSSSTRRARASSTTAGRWPRFLGLPEEQVAVELVPNGGAFGGKEDMSIQAHAALLVLPDGPAGARDAHPRGVGAHAPQAPPASP